MASLATTFTFALADEDRARLDRLIEALTNAAPAPAKADVVCHQHGNNNQCIDTVDTINIGTAPKKTEAPKTVELPQAPLPETVSAVELQAKVVQLIGRGLKAEVKDIIKKYAPRVSEIPEGKRADVMAELKALEV